ncbi:hypothetical protein HPP92_014294 [Vanilla planifolia]|uniref:Uncharacterized protein n=1 Tax=Vanilla planifolia TaxID=51239 RepID=A0A835UUM9_VANPL|nr:hypothetical protein HPP92_014294 [Vanilla planifolia]
MIRVAMAGSMQHVNSLPKVLMMYGLLRGYLKKGVLGRSCRIISFNDDGDGRDIFATLKSGPGKVSLLYQDSPSALSRACIKRAKPKLSVANF